MDVRVGEGGLVLTTQVLKTLGALGLDTTYLQQGNKVTFVATVIGQDGTLIASVNQEIQCPHCPAVVLQALIELAERPGVTRGNLSAEDRQTLSNANIWQAHDLSVFRENIYNALEAFKGGAKTSIADKLKYVGKMGG